MPFDSPLWYVRDLIVICILSPLVYYGVKRMGYYFTIVLCLYYLSGFYPNTRGASSTAICFFSIGATYALKEKLLIDLRNQFKIVLIITVIICFIASNILHIGILQRLFILISSILWIIFSSQIPDRIIKVLSRFTPAVFFIYAIHNTFVLANTSKILLKIIDKKFVFGYPLS